MANSRFIATLAPVFTVEEAKAFIQRVRREFSDATHNVTAFIIGHGPSTVAHCSDDGEPAGTAGRPALAVLQGSGLGDAAVVVTRYFGGTKLGKGGLVRAYGDAVREVLRLSPIAEKTTTCTAMLTLPYSHYERLRTLIQQYQGKIEKETFAGKITLHCQFVSDCFPAFQTALQEMSHGTLEAKVIAVNNATIIPLQDSHPHHLL